MQQKFIAGTADQSFTSGFFMAYIKEILVTILILNAAFIYGKTITVAKDGYGDYSTVQEAFDAVPEGNTQEIRIRIKNGVYYEPLKLEKNKDHVTLIGEDPEKTLLTYNRSSGDVFPNGDTVNTWTSASFFIFANDFTAINIGFENNAGFHAGQAVAVFAYGDRLKFSNCRFTGFQDVLFLSGPESRQYNADCYIVGTTDFIFGPATAVFKDCHIHSKKNSHVTAASTPKESEFGFVFFDCKLTGDPELKNVSLGRPWRPFASVTYVRCELGPHIKAEGWNNWRNPENEKTARYGEYKSYGPGWDPDLRVKWITVFTEEDLKKITLKNIFPQWDPERELEICLKDL